MRQPSTDCCWKPPKPPIARDKTAMSFTYDPRLRGGAGGYRDDRTGRIVTNSQVADALDATLSSSESQLETLYQQIRDRRLSVADWQLAMRERIKAAHISAALASAGGADQMTPADWGRVGRRIRYHYEKLDNFAQEVASGKQRIDGRMLTRMQMYEQASVNTFDILNRRAMIIAGFTEERSILEPRAHHCGQCPVEAAKGWVPIGELIPIGERQCLTRCRCKIEYRNSAKEIIQ